MGEVLGQCSRLRVTLSSSLAAGLSNFPSTVHSFLNSPRMAKAILQVDL